MRWWRSRWRSLWSACGPAASALAVAGLLVLVATGECARRDRASWAMGFEVGVAAALDGQSVRWGTCLRGGREFRCARTSDGDLVEVRVP